MVSGLNRGLITHTRFVLAAAVVFASEAEKQRRDARFQCVRLWLACAWLKQNRIEKHVRAWDWILSSQTGREGDPVKHLQRSSARALLDRQSEDIADKLALAGIDMRQPPAAEPITLLGELTGCVEQSNSTKYRHCLFVPSVAKRERAHQLRSLEAYLKSRKNGSFARYFVITNGQRIAWHDPSLRQKIQAFHAKIGTFARIALEKYGIEIVIRSSEMTLRKSISADGIHLHANILYIPPYLSKKDFSSFLSLAHKYFNAHVKDCGRIEKIEEIVKYITKPSVSAAEKAAGGVGMTDLSPQELAWLHEATHGLHIFQPYHGFRSFRAELREKRQKLYRLGDGELVRVAMPEAEQRGPASGSRENIIIGRTLPCPRFSHVYEPVSVVLNFTANPSTMDGKRRLAEIKMRQKEAVAWAAANAASALSPPVVTLPAFNVHTSTITPSWDPDRGGGKGVGVRERSKESEKLELSG